jgi:hypothetical protein
MEGSAVRLSDCIRSGIEIAGRQMEADVGHLMSLLESLDQTDECLKRAERTLFEARELLMRLRPDIHAA